MLHIPHNVHVLSTVNKPVLHMTVVTKERKKKIVLNMPVWFILICGIILEKKKLPEIGKVA